jgi:hypothetical protein
LSVKKEFEPNLDMEIEIQNFKISTQICGFTSESDELIILKLLKLKLGEIDPYYDFEIKHKDSFSTKMVVEYLLETFGLTHQTYINKLKDQGNYSKFYHLGISISHKEIHDDIEKENIKMFFKRLPSFIDLFINFKEMALDLVSIVQEKHEKNHDNAFYLSVPYSNYKKFLYDCRFTVLQSRKAIDNMLIEFKNHQIRIS